jgi:hypothetical protein
MINLKKHDPVADAVKEILQQEALKGNQDKIDANHNGKIDGEDFKILRGKKKEVKEESERTEDTLTGKPKVKKGDDVGPGADGKSSKVKLKSEEVESLEEKNWIAGAIKHPGAETAAAKKAGMSVQAYAQKHQHDSGKAGKRARLAMTLKHMKEKFEEPILDELINEVMAKDASAGDYIHDFVHSDNPKFAGKSKAKRKEMALAAYYSKKNEEVESVEEEWNKQDAVKRLKDLQKREKEAEKADKKFMQNRKQTKNEEVESVEEGWDDMVKDAKERVKSGPKPNGGSGVKQGSRYGGSKQKEEPEHEEVKEGKDPMMDAGCGSQPDFATNDAKPMKHAQSLAKKSLGRMRNEMLGKIAN